MREHIAVLCTITLAFSGAVAEVSGVTQPTSEREAIAPVDAGRDRTRPILDTDLGDPGKLLDPADCPTDLDTSAPCEAGGPPVELSLPRLHKAPKVSVAQTAWRLDGYGSIRFASRDVRVANPDRRHAA